MRYIFMVLTSPLIKKTLHISYLEYYTALIKNVNFSMFVIFVKVVDFSAFQLKSVHIFKTKER